MLTVSKWLIILFFFFLKRSLALLPGWSAVAKSWLAVTSVFHLVSSNSAASASRVAGTTGTHHHAWRIFFVLLVEMGFHYVGRDGLDLLTS